MDQQQSVLTVTVPEVEHILDYLREKHKNVEGPMLNVPAHITIQYPWMEPYNINTSVINELRELFLEVESFNFALETGWFGDEVLLLVPENPKPFVEMTKIMLEKWPEYPYYGGEYDEIEPHITLAYGEGEILKQICNEINELLPNEIKCLSIDLNVGIPGAMTICESFSLNNNSTK